MTSAAHGSGGSGFSGNQVPELGSHSFRTCVCSAMGLQLAMGVAAHIEWRLPLVAETASFLGMGISLDRKLRGF